MLIFTLLSVYWYTPANFALMWKLLLNHCFPLLSIFNSPHCEYGLHLCCLFLYFYYCHNFIFTSSFSVPVFHLFVLMQLLSVHLLESEVKMSLWFVIWSPQKWSISLSNCSFPSYFHYSLLYHNENGLMNPVQLQYDKQIEKYKQLKESQWEM